MTVLPAPRSQESVATVDRGAISGASRITATCSRVLLIGCSLVWGAPPRSRLVDVLEPAPEFVVTSDEVEILFQAQDTEHPHQDREAGSAVSYTHLRAHETDSY